MKSILLTAFLLIGLTPSLWSQSQQNLTDWPNQQNLAVTQCATNGHPSNWSIPIRVTHFPTKDTTWSDQTYTYSVVTDSNYVVYRCLGCAQFYRSPAPRPSYSDTAKVRK